MPMERHGQDKGTKLRIVGLGDSTTAGTPGFLSPLEAPPNGQGDPKSQYAYWMMHLRPDWDVLNRGINGQRSDEILARFERDVVGASPQFVIILAGVNDVYQGRPQESVRQSLSSMYARAAEAEVNPVAATILPYNTASESASTTIRQLNGWIERRAQRLGIPFCDTGRAVADPNHPDRLLDTSDGLHPDVSGYRKMGEAFVETIEAAVRSGSPRTQ